MNKYFLSCDWGTSSFRLRLVSVGNGSVIAEQATNQGIATVYAQWSAAGKVESSRLEFYLSIIRQQCQNIETATGAATAGLPVIVSGMASSSIGMMELPYTQMPFSVSGNDLLVKVIEKTTSFPNDIVLISGASTATDVMRGEETQLVGCAGNGNANTQMVIFPGTHSKHITVANDKATVVETFMTGEFFDLLSTKSILAASVKAGGDIEKTENKTAFSEGVKESSEQNLLHSSFLVRTNQLFKKCSAQANYFYLSGLLIGTELRQLLHKEVSYITIVGGNKLSENYLLALQLLHSDIDVQITGDAAATIKGQLAIYKRLYK